MPNFAIVDNIKLHFYNVYFFSLCFLVASIPTGFGLSLYALSFSLFLGVINILFIKRDFSHCYSSKIRILFFCFFLVYLFSLLYTTNIQYGIKVIFQLISIVLIPALLILNLPLKRFSILTNIYVISVSLNLLFFIVRAFYNSTLIASDGIVFNFYNENVAYGSNFIYTEFVRPHLPTYYAMYLILAIGFVFQHFLAEIRGLKRVLLIILMLLLFVGVFLCSSRAGILTFFLISFVLLFNIFKIKRKLRPTLVVLLIGFVTFFYIASNPRLSTVYRYFNAVYEGENETKVDLESTTMLRLRIWSAILNNIEPKDFFLGVGAGDAKQCLIDCYQNEGLYSAAEEKLNAHNQFIQTFFAVGFLGLSVLLYILSYAFWLSFKQRNFILFVFLIIILVNFMFESILERGFGVIFFTFFLVLLVDNHDKCCSIVANHNKSTLRKI